jgi:hypothetical protein
MPLRRPTPPASFPAEGLNAFADDLQNYFEEDNDPLYDYLIHGEQVWQQVFILTLPAIKSGDHPRDTASGNIWRILASSHDRVVAAEVALQAAGAGRWEVTGVSTGLSLNKILAAAKAVDSLAEGQIGPDLDNYELRVLRVPAISIEALWLAYLPDKNLDRVIPYHNRAGLNSTMFYGMNDCLGYMRPAAEKRIAYKNDVDRTNDVGGSQVY